MPPTFLLYLGMLLAAAAAPVMVLVAIVLTFTPKHRKLGQLSLLGGIAGGTIALVLWVVVVSTFAELGKVDGLLALLVFGAGVTAGVLVLGAWELHRRVLSNPVLNTDTERPQRAG